MLPSHVDAVLDATLQANDPGRALYASRDLQPPQQLGPVARDAFTIGARNVRFERNARGEVEAMVFSAEGVDALRITKRQE